MINYLTPLRELLLIFFLSAFFRGYMILSEDMSWLYLPSAIHGLLADLSLPLAITGISIYLYTCSSIRVARWVNFIVTNLICFDMLFFYFFHLRLNEMCLDPNIMKEVSATQRFAFAGSILLILATYRFIEKTTPLPAKRPGKNRLWSFLIPAIFLLSGSVFQLPIYHVRTEQTWDEYFLDISFSRRSRMEKSSLLALLALPYQEMAVYPVPLFLESPYYQRCLDEYESSAAKVSNSDFITRIPRIWLHMQNTSADALKALEIGFYGIETDVNYFQDQNEFFVCHDMTSNSEPGPTETLGAFLQTLATKVKPRQFIWLDIKNLTSGNQKKSVPRLSAILNECGFKDQVIIESKNQFVLRKLSARGLNTLWGLFYGISTAIIDEDLVNSIKAMTVLSGCKIVSLPFNIYNEEAEAGLASFPVALYTINDLDIIRKFSAIGNIRLMLTDLKNAWAQNW